MHLQSPSDEDAGAMKQRLTAMGIHRYARQSHQRHFQDLDAGTDDLLTEKGTGHDDLSTHRKDSRLVMPIHCTQAAIIDLALVFQTCLTKNNAAEGLQTLFVA